MFERRLDVPDAVRNRFDLASADRLRGVPTTVRPRRKRGPVAREQSFNRPDRQRPDRQFLDGVSCPWQFAIGNTTPKRLGRGGQPAARNHDVAALAGGPSVNMAEKPVVDVAALRGDMYRLIVLLFADRSVDDVEAFRNLADDHHESEVNRLLIWLAVASRQLLDIDGSAAGEPCGRICWDYPDGAWKDLTFRGACNTVIHAVEIIPYDLEDVGEASRACYDGKITVRGRGRRNGANTRARMDFEKFAECCLRLSNDFLQG